MKMAGMGSNRTLMKICMVLFGMVTMYVIVSEIHFERECAYFCNNDENQECFLRRSAVLIYDHDVAPHEMSFSQNAHPRINVADYASEVATGRYFDINCPVEHYWPRVSTLRRYNSCAVVGNSGILSDSNCGSVIDAHDYIIRANLAPIQGYEADVGERVHLTILNFETLLFLYTNLTTRPQSDRWHHAYVQRVRYLNDSILWYSKSTLQRNSTAYLQGAVHVLKDLYHLPIQMAYSWRSVSIEKFYGLKHYATTGFNAYVIAKTFCNHVTLYGFYPSQETEGGLHIPHHYYEEVIDYEYNNKVHNQRGEMRKLRELEAAGEVTIVTDLCPGGARKRAWVNKAKGLNRGAMVDPKFAFRLDNERLKEIFNVADKNRVDGDDDDNDDRVDEVDVDRGILPRRKGSALLSALEKGGVNDEQQEENLKNGNIPNKNGVAGHVVAAAAADDDAGGGGGGGGGGDHDGDVGGRRGSTGRDNDDDRRTNQKTLTEEKWTTEGDNGNVGKKETRDIGKLNKLKQIVTKTDAIVPEPSIDAAGDVSVGGGGGK